MTDRELIDRHREMMLLLMQCPATTLCARCREGIKMLLRSLAVLEKKCDGVTLNHTSKFHTSTSSTLDNENSRQT